MGRPSHLHGLQRDVTRGHEEILAWWSARGEDWELGWPTFNPAPPLVASESDEDRSWGAGVAHIQPPPPPLVTSESDEDRSWGGPHSILLAR